MSQEFEDPRKELLEDLLQWLEWQASCGGEVWPVERPIARTLTLTSRRLLAIGLPSRCSP